MLRSQCEKLRDRADELRMLASGMDAPYIVPSTKLTMAYAMSSAASEMREAADTIEGLQRQLAKNSIAELRADYDTSRHAELFGTPERAARTLETVADSLFSSAWSDDNATLSDVMCALVGKCDECVAQGLPGRGVSTKCGEVDYDALLRWLKQEVDA